MGFSDGVMAAVAVRESNRKYIKDEKKRKRRFYCKNKT